MDHLVSKSLGNVPIMVKIDVLSIFITVFVCRVARFLLILSLLSVLSKWLGPLLRNFTLALLHYGHVNILEMVLLVVERERLLLLLLLWVVKLTILFFSFVFHLQFAHHASWHPLKIHMSDAEQHHNEKLVIGRNFSTIKISSTQGQITEKKNFRLN